MSTFPSALPIGVLAAAASPSTSSASADAKQEARAEFAAFYARHAPGVHRFLSDLLGDRALAADATQETFSRFHRESALVSRHQPVAWLFGIARNVSLEFRRARARRERVMPSASGPCAWPLDDAPADPRDCPERALLARETVAIVCAALETLDEERRAMLLMRLDHGLSYEEIAEAMSCSLAKVKVDIHRARAALRAALEARGEPRR